MTKKNPVIGALPLSPIQGSHLTLAKPRDYSDRDDFLQADRRPPTADTESFANRLGGPGAADEFLRQHTRRSWR